MLYLCFYNIQLKTDYIYQSQNKWMGLTAPVVVLLPPLVLVAGH